MKLALHHPNLNRATALQIFQACQLNPIEMVEHRPGLYSVELSETNSPTQHATNQSSSSSTQYKIEHATQHNLIRNVCSNASCDWALIPNDFTPNAFKVLAMDMDSTLINIECIDEIADFVGKKAEVSAITEAAMRGEITNFSESLKRRVALLAGVHVSHLNAVFEQRLQLNPGAQELLKFAKKQGWVTLLVSGGFSFFTDRLKTELGLNHTKSNTLEIVNEKLTGQVLGEIVDAQNKADTVKALCESLDQPSSTAIVMGDGANDLNMMAIAGASIAYHAKPVVQQQAHFSINHGGLDTLLAWFEVNTETNT